MNYAAIVHRPTEDYVRPEGRESLAIALSTARGDLQAVSLWYWTRGESDPAKRRKKRMDAALRDAYHDYYRVRVSTPGISAYTRYCFCLETEKEKLWYGSSGFQETEPGMEENFFEFLWPNPTDSDRAPTWAKEQIYYQIFPERFCCGDPALTPQGAEAWGSAPTRENFMGGDLKGILRKLDYIESLGATCLYLTPIFKAPSNHKYDTANYYEIDPAFGTKDDLRALVTEVHRRGMRILLDGVFNHCGYFWPLFQDLLEKGERSPYRDWFFPHSFPVTAETCNYDCVGHYKWMPKLNLANPDTEQYFIEVGKYWIRDFNIDGWRLDVADEVPTAFWTAFSTAIRRLKPDALLLGETWGDAGRLVRPDRLDTAMNYLFRDVAADWLAKDAIPASAVDHRLNQMLSLYPEAVSQRLYNLLDSHDTARFRYLCSDKNRHKLAVALQMTFPGCPAIYYGDEIGLEGANDPGCRMAMEWAKQKQDRELLDWYQRLIALRKQSPSLRDGSYKTAFTDDESNVYAFYRFCESETSLVILNAGSAATQTALKENGWRKVFPAPSTDDFPVVSSDQVIEVPPCSAEIYQKKGKVQK